MPENCCGDRDNYELCIASCNTGCAGVDPAGLGGCIGDCGEYSSCLKTYRFQRADDLDLAPSCCAVYGDCTQADC